MTSVPEAQEVDDAANAKESLEQTLARYNLLLMVFTGVLAVATIGLFVSTTFLWLDANGSSERQLRAYVLSDASEIDRLALNKSVHIAFRIKNFGQTPAKNIVVSGIATLGKISPDEPPKGPPMMLAPGGEADYSLTTDASLSQSQMDAIVRGENGLYIKIEITYADAFGVMRHTHIAQYWKGNGTPPPTTIPLSNAESGNDWD